MLRIDLNKIPYLSTHMLATQFFLDICAAIFHKSNETIGQVLLSVWNPKQTVTSFKKVIVNSGCNLQGYSGQNFSIQTLHVSIVPCVGQFGRHSDSL
jgi:hypothetical protein